MSETKIRGRAGWVDFFSEFEARKDRKTTLSDFCLDKGVSYAMARKWSKKVKGEIEQNKEQEHEQEHSTVKQEQTKKQEHSPKKEREQLLPKFDRKKLLEKNQWYESCASHGAYAKYFPKEIVKELESEGLLGLTSIASEIFLTKCRLLALQQRRKVWDETEEKKRAYQLEEIEEGVNDTTGGFNRTLRKRPDFEGQEERLIRLLMKMLTTQEQLRQLKQHSDEERIMRRAEIIDYGRASGWTYTQIGMEIERFGFEVPFTIKQLIQQELELPIIEQEDNGITDEELEKLSREFEEKNKDAVSWLEERREDVKKIHAKTDMEKVSD